MNAAELIRKKRNGGSLTRPELEFLIGGYLDGGVMEYQMSSFLMAVYFRGMDAAETATLTDVMLRSGTVVDLSSVPGIKVDKHSTGGVGDKVSLILSPMVAACGVPVPMISGRGLGHTGGTLDKLEAIPGFRTRLSLEEYRAVLGEVGAVMMGQTADVVPADRRMYALRDVTATVESIPLIAGSIMSKKIAEGINALVLDVKVGRGAFMRTDADAAALATTLIAIGGSFGITTKGFLTGMDEPLGYAVGNWLEVEECLECLRGKDIPGLMEVTYVLGGAMVMMGGKASTIAEGIRLCRRAIESGRALGTFLKLVECQGGDCSYLLDGAKYGRSGRVVEVRSRAAGFVGEIDALEVGLVSVGLGAGRSKLDEPVDPRAGIILKKKVGDPVERGETLALIHTDREGALSEAEERLPGAFVVTPARPARAPLVRAMVDDLGVHPWPGA